MSQKSGTSVTELEASQRMEMPKDVADKCRLRAATDLVAVVAFFALCNLATPALDPLLRGKSGLSGVIALALYQFTLEGIAVLAVMAARHEHFSEYGFVSRGLGKSVLLGLALALLYDAALSWYSGEAYWLPFRRHTTIRMLKSSSAGVPGWIAGLLVITAVWGFCEALFGIFFAKKLDRIMRRGRSGWLSPGALGFALFNGSIHLAAGQGWAGFAFSFASGYALTVVPAVTGNASGGVLVQLLTNAVGPL